MFTSNAKNRAFTAIEAVVYTAVLSVMMAAVFGVVNSSYKSHNFVLSQSETVHEARFGLENMLADIREASYADNGAYPIKSMAPNEIIFYADIDNDKKIEQVRYFLDGSFLKRGVIKSSGMPAEYDPANENVKIISKYLKNQDASQDLFKYYDSSANEISDLSKVLDLRSVVITLLMDKDPAKDPVIYSYSSTAALRNIINAYEF